MIDNRYIISLILAGAPILMAHTPLMAQEETIPERQVTITRDYVPETNAIVKLDAQPALELPVTSRSEAVFSTTDVNVAKQRDLGVMAAQQVIATENPYKIGWVRADFGNYMNGNLDASARYKGFQLDLKATTFSSDQLRWYDHAPMLFGNDSYSGESLLSGERWDKAMLMNGKAKLSYDYIFLNDAHLHVYVGARGQKNNMPSSRIVLNEKTNEYRAVGGNTKQKFGSIDAGAALDYEDMSLSLDYRRTGVRLPDMPDTNPDLVNHDLNLKGEYGMYDDSNWRGKASLELGNHWDNEYHFTIEAEGELSYLPNEYMLNRFYAKASVGTERPVLFDLMEQNPLLFPIDHRTYVPFRDDANKLYDCFKSPTHVGVTLGYESNEMGNFQWSIYAGMQQTWNELACVMMVHPSSLYKNLELIDRPVTPGNQHRGPFMRLVNHDCLEFPMGFHIGYELNRYFSTTIDGQAKIHSCGIADANDSHLNCDVHIKSNPIKALTLDLSFVGRFLREGTLSSNFDYPKHSKYSDEINLHNITDLNFDAEYQLMDFLSVYGSVRNMLCQRYELWPGIPAQKLNFHIGFQYRF